jgi:SSS family solute:Na+ symporter
MIVPFAVVMPGIVAVELYGDEVITDADTANPDDTAATGHRLRDNPDKAYPILIRKLIPPGLRGLIFAAIAGAVISSLASMLNSASTIVTIDLFKRHLHPDASQKMIVGIGRVLTALFVVAGCLIAPQLGRFGVFDYIQEFQGYISPGILAAFVFGFVVRRAPAAAGVAALLVNPPVYGLLQWQFGHVAFLNRMAITFGAALLTMGVVTVICPRTEPKPMPVRSDIDMTPAPSVLWLGGAVIAGVVAFYIVFW